MTDLSVFPDEEKRRGNRRRRRNRRSVLAVLVALLVVLGLLGGAAAAVLGLGERFKGAFDSPPADYAGPGTGSVQVEVRPGQTAADIARTLERKDVVRTSGAFVAVANAEPRSAGIQPGFYGMQRKMAAADALQTLLDPSARIQSRVTLPEGLRLDEAVKKLAAETEISLEAYEKALREARRHGLPRYAAKRNAEGFLFPATYDVPPNAEAGDVLAMAFEAYAAAAEEAGVERTNRTPYEIVTIASLVEAEARLDRDFGKVARVIYNRLRRGMPLQFDSTVNYALKADKEIVTYNDLGVDSPYNTYENTGLPPAPINSPGAKALDAAVNPTAGDWLYFVTTDPEAGTTKFTGDYQQFLRFKRELKSNQ
jgi:UPF0755 protein